MKLTHKLIDEWANSLWNYEPRSTILVLPQSIRDDPLVSVYMLGHMNRFDYFYRPKNNKYYALLPKRKFYWKRLRFTPWHWFYEIDNFFTPLLYYYNNSIFAIFDLMIEYNNNSPN